MLVKRSLYSRDRLALNKRTAVDTLAPTNLKSSASSSVKGCGPLREKSPIAPSGLWSPSSGAHKTLLTSNGKVPSTCSLQRESCCPSSTLSASWFRNTEAKNPSPALTPRRRRLSGSDREIG